MQLLSLRRFATPMLLALLLAFTVATARAVDVNGRIKGTVTDPSGAVVPGAQVIATNTATGVKYTTKSQGGGDYLFPQLPVGTYSVTVTAPGFQGFKATGIVLNIDQEYVEAVKLAVGNTSETLEVAADAVQVNTTDMQINNIVNSTQMAELPLIGRNFTGLELIEPGVQASSDRFGTSSVSGAQSQQSEYLINGADTNDISLNTVAVNPNLDAIDQFNLIDGPLNAEYDRNSGGIVSATIKQGTNHFHGDGFEFYRDTFLNTPNFFQKNITTGVAVVPKYHQNIFGGTIGGPIFRDKLFFFFGYQGTHQIVPQSGGNINVLSTNERTGNFSVDNPASQGTRPGLPVTQSDGTTTCPTWGSFSCNPIPGTIAIVGCTTPGETWAQCAYDKKGIFSDSTNSIATNLITKYLPAVSSGYNYLFAPVTTQTINQYLGDISAAAGPRNQFNFLYLYNKSTAADTLPFTGATVPGFGDQNVLTVTQYTFDYVRQLSNTAVNDFAAHYTRFNYQAVIPQNIVTPSSLGFSINPQDAAAASVPTISISGLNGVNFTLGFSTNGPQPRIDQVIQLDDNLSKTFGHHTFKIGYDGRRFNVSNPFYARNSGSYGFNDTSSVYTTGDGALDFVLGVPASYSQGSGATIQAQAFLNYMFIQDTWKVSNSLTVDYGLGYSIDTPMGNHQYNGEGIACFIPGEKSKIFTSAPTGVVYPGDPGCNTAGQATTRYSEFGPRFGFAWSPDLGFISDGNSNKFAIRGGFGIYYDRTEEESSLQTLETPPFGISSSGANDYGANAPAFANPYMDLNTGAVNANKFPYSSFPKAGTAPDYSSSEPLDISTYGPSFRAPYAENFQLSVERELPSRIVARLSYIGSLARHNQVTYEGNYETAAGHAACLAGSEYSPFTGSTISCSSSANRNDQSYYFPNNTIGGTIDPNTGYPGIVSAGEVGSLASSSYNSMQASVQKALTHGLSFQFSYTYSHALDNGSSFENSGFGSNGARGYNQFQQSLNYGDSNYDARHRVVFAPIYISPILHGYGTFSPMNLALSGWEVSGITVLATGFPYDISYAGGTSLSLYCSADFNFYACPDVPNQIAPLVRGNERTRLAGTGYTQWFQAASFAPETLGTFGNVHRDPYHGPGINNTNLILAKNFNLDADGVKKLQIRMESDNVFNHTQFANPTSTYGSSNLGRISGVQTAARVTQLAAKFYF